MILKRQNTKHEGNWGEIFCTIDNKAIKIFKKNKEYRHEQIKNIFESEIEAYKIISSNNELKKYIPIFEGKCDVSKIIDIDGKDISENFYIDCAYKMEFIDGTLNKSYGCESGKCPILIAFKNAGVHFVNDCAAFVDDSGNALKIIDFATQDFDVFIRNF